MASIQHADFFGGGGSEQTSTSYTPYQLQSQQGMFQLYGPEMGKGQPVYGGERVAGLTPYQQEALNMGGWSQYLQPGMAGPMYGQTGAALSNILAGEMGAEPITQQQINTLYKTAYEQPAMRQWSQNIQPTIREAYSGPGFWSTSRMESEKQGAQELSNWLGTQYGQMQWSADQANRALEEARANRALSAIPTGIAYSQVPMQQTLAALQGRTGMYGLATAEQQQQQAQINAAIQKFIEQNRISDPEELAVIMQLLNMSYTTSEGVQTGPGIGYNWLSGLGNPPDMPSMGGGGGI